MQALRVWHLEGGKPKGNYLLGPLRSFGDKSILYERRSTYPIWEEVEGDSLNFSHKPGGTEKCSMSISGTTRVALSYQSSQTVI